KDVDLRRLETGDGDIEVDLGRRKDLQFLGKHCEVPARIKSDLVVRNHQGTLLQIGEGYKHYGRHLLHAVRLGRVEPPVTSNEFALFIDEYRVGEAETFDAGFDLRDLT